MVRIPDNSPSCWILLQCLSNWTDRREVDLRGITVFLNVAPPFFKGALKTWDGDPARVCQRAHTKSLENSKRTKMCCKEGNEVLFISEYWILWLEGWRKLQFCPRPFAVLPLYALATESNLILSSRNILGILCGPCLAYLLSIQGASWWGSAGDRRGWAHMAGGVVFFRDGREASEWIGNTLVGFWVCTYPISP